MKTLCPASAHVRSISSFPPFCARVSPSENETPPCPAVPSFSLPPPAPLFAPLLFRLRRLLPISLRKSSSTASHPAVKSFPRLPPQPSPPDLEIHSVFLTSGSSRVSPTCTGCSFFLHLSLIKKCYVSPKRSKPTWVSQKY